jgi:3-hydroxy-9,10-secoandrosta-1,3,5(10)-triene-9,17-dione monooxygenase
LRCDTNLSRSFGTWPVSSIVEPLLQQAAGLVPALAAREAATGSGRSVLAETIADFHRTGILRIMQPSRFGGHQASFELFSRSVEILAEGCAASAWVYAVLAEHQWIIACMPDRAQVDVWGHNPDTVASSSLAPRETARRTIGGWRLSGRFPFSSGCQHAQWAIIGARAEDAAGNRPTRYLLVPMEHIEIVDDWHVLGLRGTGSCSLVLTDVFVPEHRTVLLSDLLEGTTPGSLILPEYRLLRAPRGYLVPFSLPGVMFTLARRTLDLVPATLRTRISRGVREVAASEVVQMRLGEAAALIETAVLIMHTRRTESLAAVDAGRAISAQEVTRNRRDVTLAAEQLRRGLDLLVEISGARSVYDADPLQALVRDALTIGTHTVVSHQGAMVPYGRLMLGLPAAGGEA